MNQPMRRRVRPALAKKRDWSCLRPEVEVVFNGYPRDLQVRLLSLRRLILETAATTEGVGELEETLKWGQPSYLTSASKSGSTIRIDQVKSGPGYYAIFFHCQTDLVATFRELYPRQFRYRGNRSILFERDDEIPERALRHCISLALTYHLRKRRTVER
jgi:Domain of unknown function (DU1801)